MAFDFNSLGRNDKVALVAGGAASLLTLFPWFYTVSIDTKELTGGAGGLAFDRSDGFTAWHEVGVLGCLLILAATGLVVARLLGDVLPAGAPWNLITAASAALGGVIVILYGLFGIGTDADGFPGISEGVGWSGWLLFVAVIVFAVFAFFGFQSSGEKIPEIKKDGETPPAPPAA